MGAREVRLIPAATSVRVLSPQRAYPAVNDSDLTLEMAQQVRDDSLENTMMDTSLTKSLQLAKLPTPESDESASSHEGA